MILITQDCAEMIRVAVNEYTKSGKVIPSVLEIPSKDTPYDPRKDSTTQQKAVRWIMLFVVWGAGLARG